MKGFLLTGSIDDDSRLECDLTGPGYTLDAQTRIKLESKDEIKKRGVDRLTMAMRCHLPSRGT